MITFKHFTNFMISILIKHFINNYDFIHIVLYDKSTIKNENVKILFYEKLTRKCTIIEIYLNG